MITPNWAPIVRLDGATGEDGVRYNYVYDEIRFKIALAGRRSRKTLHAKRILVKRALFDRLKMLRLPEVSHPEWASKLSQDDPWRYAYGAPTQDQANDISWDDLKRLVPKELIRRIYGGKKPVIKTILNTEIHVLGMDEARRIEGQPWNGLVLDEFPDMKAGVWEDNVFPVLSDRQAWVIILGVPDAEKENNDKFLELFDKGQLQPGQPGYDPNFKSYTWTSEEVLPESEIILARSTLTPRAYRVEYLASRESMPGRAYPDFVKTTHANETFEYNPVVPLVFGCDFNRNYHNWGLYQYHNGDYWILSDLFVFGGTVEAMCNEAQEKMIAYGLPITGKGCQFYGDHSGVQKRAEATEASWTQIKNRFPEAEYLYTPQPPITDRLEKLNSFILNAKGERHLHVHQTDAPNHVTDFEKVSRTMAFAGVGGKDGELTHASSAFGYYVHQHQRALNAPNFFAMNAQ